MNARRIALTLTLAGVPCALLAFCTVHGTSDANAQRLDPRRPSSFVVGSPAGAAPTLRGNARRTGATRDALPGGPLRIAWRKTIGLTIDHPALVGGDGTIAVVTSRGDVVFLDEEGNETTHVTAATTAASAGTLTSDGTVVFTTAGGDAIGVRRNAARPRFVTRIGGERNQRAAPLALDDGGVVVATATDLVVLDAEGAVRSRVSLAEAPAAPLLAAGDKILVVTSSGAVFGWVPGREVVRIGSFGAPIDGGAALADDNTLVAVIEGNHLVELDLTRGARSTRSVAPAGLFLGPASVRPRPKAAGAGSLATLLALTPTRAFVVTLDSGGTETARAPIAVLSPSTLPDGGPAPLVAPAHTGPLVDGRGGVAFAAPDGHVGIVTPEGAVDTIGELICSRSGRSAGVAGLTAAGRGTFLVTCEGGAVARVSGPDAEPLRPGSRTTVVKPGAAGPGGPAPSSSTLRGRTPAPPTRQPDDDDDDP